MSSQYTPYSQQRRKLFYESGILPDAQNVPTQDDLSFKTPTEYGYDYSRPSLNSQEMPVEPIEINSGTSPDSNIPRSTLSLPTKLQAPNGTTRTRPIPQTPSIAVNPGWVNDNLPSRDTGSIAGNQGWVNDNLPSRDTGSIAGNQGWVNDNLPSRDTGSIADNPGWESSNQQSTIGLHPFDRSEASVSTYDSVSDNDVPNLAGNPGWQSSTGKNLDVVDSQDVGVFGNSSYNTAPAFNPTALPSRDIGVMGNQADKNDIDQQALKDQQDIGVLGSEQGRQQQQGLSQAQMKIRETNQLLANKKQPIGATKNIVEPEKYESVDLDPSQANDPGTAREAALAQLAKISPSDVKAADEAYQRENKGKHLFSLLGKGGQALEGEEFATGVNSLVDKTTGLVRIPVKQSQADFIRAKVKEYKDKGVLASLPSERVFTGSDVGNKVLEAENAVSPAEAKAMSTVRGALSMIPFSKYALLGAADKASQSIFGYQSVFDTDDIGQIQGTGKMDTAQQVELTQSQQTYNQGGAWVTGLGVGIAAKTNPLVQGLVAGTQAVSQLDQDPGYQRAGEIAEEQAGLPGIAGKGLYAAQRFLGAGGEAAITFGALGPIGNVLGKIGGARLVEEVMPSITGKIDQQAIESVASIVARRTGHVVNLPLVNYVAAKQNGREYTRWDLAHDLAMSLGFNASGIYHDVKTGLASYKGIPLKPEVSKALVEQGHSTPIEEKGIRPYEQEKGLEPYNERSVVPGNPARDLSAMLERMPSTGDLYYGDSAKLPTPVRETGKIGRDTQEVQAKTNPAEFITREIENNYLEPPVTQDLLNGKRGNAESYATQRMEAKLPETVDLKNPAVVNKNTGTKSQSLDFIAPDAISDDYWTPGSIDSRSTEPIGSAKQYGYDTRAMNPNPMVKDTKPFELPSRTREDYRTTEITPMPYRTEVPYKTTEKTQGLGSKKPANMAARRAGLEVTKPLEPKGVGSNKPTMELEATKPTERKPLIKADTLAKRPVNILRGGGWKLHLSVPEANRPEVNRLLQESGILYKMGQSGDQSGKDFTVYVGHKDDTTRVAQSIQESVGDLLDPVDPKSDAGRMDIPFAEKVYGRFDASREHKDSPHGFHQYAAPLNDKGIPSLRDDVSNFLYGDEATKAEIRTNGVKRSDARLKKLYGEFYTGKASRPTMEINDQPTEKLPQVEDQMGLDKHNMVEARIKAVNDRAEAEQKMKDLGVTHADLATMVRHQKDFVANKWPGKGNKIAEDRFNKVNEIYKALPESVKEVIRTTPSLTELKDNPEALKKYREQFPGDYAKAQGFGLFPTEEPIDLTGSYNAEAKEPVAQEEGAYQGLLDRAKGKTEQQFVDDVLKGKFYENDYYAEKDQWSKAGINKLDENAIKKVWKEAQAQKPKEVVKTEATPTEVVPEVVKPVTPSVEPIAETGKGDAHTNYDIVDDLNKSIEKEQTSEEIQNGVSAPVVNYWNTVQTNNDTGTEKIPGNVPPAHIDTGKLTETNNETTKPDNAIFQVPPREVNLDPARFQFKREGINAKGVTDLLSSVKNWDPESAGIIHVWRDPADGKIYAVNGHHRTAKAQALLDAGQQIDHLNVMFIKADSAPEARLQGMMLNLKEGSQSASPIDVARVMREGNMTAEELRAQDVPMDGKLTKQSVALSQLPQKIFDLTANGELTPNKAIAISEAFPGKKNKQLELWKILKEDPETSEALIRETAKMMDQFPDIPVEDLQGSLFEPEALSHNLIAEGAKLSRAFKDLLNKDKRLLGALTNAETLNRVGEVANVKLEGDVFKEKVAESKIAGNMFDKLAQRDGSINKIIVEGAKRIAINEESVRKVSEDLIEQVKTAINEEISQSFGRKNKPGEESVSNEERQGDLGGDNIIQPSEPDLFSGIGQSEAGEIKPESTEVAQPVKTIADIPDGVRRRIRESLATIKTANTEIIRARALDAKFGGEGRYESDFLESVKERHEAAQKKIDEFRRIAKEEGVDPDQALEDLGGYEPLLERSENAKAWASDQAAKEVEYQKKYGEVEPIETKAEPLTGSKVIGEEQVQQEQVVKHPMFNELLDQLGDTFNDSSVYVRGRKGPAGRKAFFDELNTLADQGKIIKDKGAKWPNPEIYTVETPDKGTIRIIDKGDDIGIERGQPIDRSFVENLVIKSQQREANIKEALDRINKGLGKKRVELGGIFVEGVNVAAKFVELGAHRIFQYAAKNAGQLMEFKEFKDQVLGDLSEKSGKFKKYFEDNPNKLTAVFDKAMARYKLGKGLETYRNAKPGILPNDVAGFHPDSILNQPTAERVKTPIHKYIIAFLKANPLFNVSGGLKDVASTFGNLAALEVGKIPGSIADKGMSKAFSSPRQILAPSLSRIFQSSKLAATQGSKEFWRIMKKEGLSPEEQKRLETHEVFSGNGFVSRAFDGYINTVFRFRGALDKFAHTYAANQSVLEQTRLTAMEMMPKASEVELKHAEEYIQDLVKRYVISKDPKFSKMTEYRQWKRQTELTSGENAIAKSIFDRAVTDAEEATFNNDNMVSTKINELKQYLGEDNRRIAGGIKKGGAILLDYHLPYPKVATNVAARLWNLSPIGAATKGLINIDAAIRGGYMSKGQQRAIGKAVGDGLVGSALMGMGFLAAKYGLANNYFAYNPFDQSERGEINLEQASNKEMGSFNAMGAVNKVVNAGATAITGKDEKINVPGTKTWIKVSDLKPLGNLFSYGAMLAFESNAKDKTGAEASLTDKGLSIFGNTLSMAMEQPVIRSSVDTPMKIFSEKGREQELGKFVDRVIPGMKMAGEITSAYNAFQGLPNKEKRLESPHINLGKSVYDRIIDKTPYRNELPDKHTAYGETIDQQGTKLFSPAEYRNATHMGTNKVLSKFNVDLSLPTRNKEESTAQYEERAERTGKLFHKNVTDLIRSEAFKHPPEYLRKMATGTKDYMPKLSDNQIRKAMLDHVAAQSKALEIVYPDAIPGSIIKHYVEQYVNKAKQPSKNEYIDSYVNSK